MTLMKYAALGATTILTISSQPVATRTLTAQSGAAAAIVHSEFLFETAPFPSVHASTIADTRDGLVAAWFGGTREGAPDVGIWVSRHAKGAWTAPVEVATGVQADGTRHPCWNPVLFEMPDRSLALFYKVGPDPRNWWGMVRASKDGGQTWGEARRLPDGILGPIKNKPVRLADGTIISPSSSESNDKPSLWRIHFERSADNGSTWTIVRPPVVAGAPELQAIQPSILVYPGGRLQAVGRTRSRARLSGLVRRRREDVGGANPHDAAEPKLGDGRGDAQGRPTADRLQPHGEGPLPAERRGLAKRHGLGSRTRPRE